MKPYTCLYEIVNLEKMSANNPFISLGCSNNLKLEFGVKVLNSRLLMLIFLDRRFTFSSVRTTNWLLISILLLYFWILYLSMHSSGLVQNCNRCNDNPLYLGWRLWKFACPPDTQWLGRSKLPCWSSSAQFFCIHFVY